MVVLETWANQKNNVQYSHWKVCDYKKKNRQTQQIVLIPPMVLTAGSRDLSYATICITKFGMTGVCFVTNITSPHKEKNI